MQENNEDSLVRSAAAPRPAMTRRGLLLRFAAAGALFAAGGTLAAGCGGGGDDDDEFDDELPGSRYEGTYRAIARGGGPGGGDLGASFTVDQVGRLTFWTVNTGNQPFTDFGQTVVDRDGSFEQVIDGVRTRGRVEGNRIRGRTEDLDSGFAFDFDAGLQPRLVNTLPPQWLTGTFAGQPIFNNVEFYTVLGVSRDGNATVFGAFDDFSTGDIDYYYYESASFGQDGNVEEDADYFLFLEQDRLEIRDLGTDDDVQLTLISGADSPEIGLARGQRVELRLQPNRLGRSVTRSFSNGKTLPRGDDGAKALERLKGGFTAR